MAELTLTKIEFPDDGGRVFEMLEQSATHVVASRTQRLYATGEQVECVASIKLVDGKWTGAFRLESNEDGDSTYHAETELDALRALSFDTAQAAMDATCAAAEEGFLTLAEAREADDESDESTDE
jgi:hypothetical protein